MSANQLRASLTPRRWTGWFATLRHRGVNAALDGGTLLDGVRQLVGDQFAAARALGLELILTEEDVLADRERMRAED